MAASFSFASIRSELKNRGKLIDIAVNLTDPLFRGINHKGKKIHENDFDLVLKRAFDAGLYKIIISGTSLPESKAALDLANTNERLFCTVGCHPSRSKEFDESGNADQYLQDLLELAIKGMEQGKAVAIGECGLDYAELNECPKETQIKYFEKQFMLAEKTGLPMFLHCRDAGADFIKIIRENRHRFSEGVVHSFTGSEDELRDMLDLNLHISLNGCSLRTDERLRIANLVPMSRLMIETDGPWCDVQSSHAGFKYIKTKIPAKPKDKFEMGTCVQRRNEPCHIWHVVEILTANRQIDTDEFLQTVYDNTCRVFFPANKQQQQKRESADEDGNKQ